MHPLIEAEELSRRLDDLRLFDIRWSLTDPDHGVSAYQEGHIPGAVFVDLESDLTGEDGPGRHPLPTVDQFAATLGRLGVSPDDEVVVYDDVSGTIAARMWWMLRAIGHVASRVLDGGLAAWLREELPLETGTYQAEPAVYPTPRGFGGVATIDQVPGRQLIDARAGERYRGEVEPVDPKAGHIPGAVSIPSAMNLDREGQMKTPDQLSEIYTPYRGAITSCGSGVTACHAALAMAVAGLEMPDVYIGSFSEWSSQDHPVSTGPEP